MLVDLPGYGYAEAPKREIARWTGLIARYLKGRASLRRVLLLLDARFGIKETDKPLLKQLDEAAVSFQAVLTKCDLVEADELRQKLPGLAHSLAKHVAAHPVIQLTSAESGAGIAALRASLADLAEARSAR
jgi:GTP-binding protein